MLNSSIVISPLVLFCFQGRLIKQVGELITFFCQFKCLLALAPFAILQKIRYTDWIANNNILSLLKKNTAEPEVIAAGAESSELYFRSIEPRTSKYFWQAALHVEDGTEEMLKIKLTDGYGEKIVAGDFLLCLIKAKIENGVCFISKDEFAENLFSKDARRHAVALRFPDKTVVAGQPVLGAVL